MDKDFKYYIREARRMSSFDKEFSKQYFADHQKIFELNHSKYRKIGKLLIYDIYNNVVGLDANYIYIVDSEDTVVMILEYDMAPGNGLQVQNIEKSKLSLNNAQWGLFAFLLKHNLFKYILTGSLLTPENEKSHKNFINNNTNLKISLYNTKDKTSIELVNFEDVFDKKDIMQIRIDKL